jgi:hypothetical protein
LFSPSIQRLKAKDIQMNRIKLGAAAAVLLVTSGAAIAQPYQGWDRSQATPAWDRDAFWRDAPSDIRQRIDWLQRRIDRGVQDGSLTRREGDDLYRRLDYIRRDARSGYITPDRRDRLQARLDDLSSQVRWQRRDGDRNYASYGNRHEDSRFATNYDASRYYRDDSRYTERRLSDQDEVYRGSDGRYYCKRSDGTTGLVIGAIGGGAVGNVIDGGHNRVAGTLIGGALGALAGRAIDQSSDVRCR